VADWVLDFWVPGAPKTKGSLTPRAPRCHCCDRCRGYVGQPQLRDSVGSKRWRQLVAYSAERAYQAVAGPPDGWAWPLTGPIELELIYYLPVDAAKLTGQGSGDLDKLERNIFDALQDAGVYENDAQVVACTHRKKTVQSVRPVLPGVQIRVAMAGEG
jgi:Holliday junction resolvase RusA-like endonuclease